MNYKDEIKAIMFDYDGTLIDFDYQASDYTRKALDLLKDKDYILCISSGRPCYLALKAFNNVFGEYPLDYIFGCNGSEIMDVKSGQIKLISPVSALDVRYLAEMIKEDYLVLGIYDELNFLVNKKVDNESIKRWMDARWLNPIVYDYSLNDLPRNKVLLLNDPKDRQKEIEYLKSIDLTRFETAFSSPLCLEIAAKGVSKANTCDILAEMLNIDNKQILSFGDAQNDMGMLLNSTGVVMGNATQEYLDLIALHTGHVQKEGIYTFLKENNLI